MRQDDGSSGAPDDVLRAIELLETLAADPDRLAALAPETYRRLREAAGRVARPDPWFRRELARAARRKRRHHRRASDEAALATTGIRRARAEAVFRTPPALPDPTLAPPAEVSEERTCYVCKASFRELHHFYDQMCSPCAELNWLKRHQTADLRGRVALVTGARVKIGYQAAIMLLRAGAEVIALTRFPVDAAARYAREDDFGDWGERLCIRGLDLRHTPSVDAFARDLGETRDRLDFILNNACQTVRRPPGFYDHLMDRERQTARDLPAAERRLLAAHERFRRTLPAKAGPRALGIEQSAELSQLELVSGDDDRSAGIFPRGALDADLQQIDLREHNSWRLRLHEVPAIELLEVQLVNAVAPFILNARLKPLMMRQPSADKHIVNVSAVEGQFYRRFKTDRHPHTNMAKAALNMMTRTSAPDYHRDGIHMNSVDTGWVTDEDPAHLAARKTEVHGFHPPLDIVDGAARICDPIFSGFLSGTHAWGQFFKDYRPTDW